MRGGFGNARLVSYYVVSARGCFGIVRDGQLADEDMHCMTQTHCIKCESNDISIPDTLCIIFYSSRLVASRSSRQSDDNGMVM